MEVGRAIAAVLERQLSGGENRFRSQSAEPKSASTIAAWSTMVVTVPSVFWKLKYTTMSRAKRPMKTSPGRMDNLSCRQV